MTKNSIHTLNARDNVLLDVVKEHFNLDENAIHREINGTFDYVLSILKQKKINYQDLKGALTPQINRNEIALVFDSKKTNSGCYGSEVFEKLIPLFDKRNSCSVLGGDLIGGNKLTEKLFDEFSNNIIPVKIIDYVHHSQFYIVYINNLSENMVRDFNIGLNEFEPYVGYFDLTYSSYLKTYFSTILVHFFIKNKSTIIAGHEDDVDNDTDSNLIGFPFEKYGFKCRSLQSMYYYLFLSYKIERQVFDGLESDTNFSLSAVSNNILNIYDFKFQIEEEKLKYLLKEKEASLKKLGLAEITVLEMERLIKSKINDNYIYNLTLIKEHGTIKFDILIEIKPLSEYKNVKLRIGLEYKPKEKTLRLITLFG